MYGSSDEVYVEAMTEDIRSVVMLLASHRLKLKFLKRDCLKK